MKTWSKLVAALLCAALLTLCGCAQAQPAPTQAPATQAPAAQEPATEAPAAPTQAPAAQEPAAEASAYPVTVTDSRGEVTLSQEPQTIVSVSPTMTEILFALGVGDKVVGRTEYCNYPEAALSVPTVGSMYDMDLEKILELQPDLVLGSMLFQEEDAQKMDELGITVAAFTDCATMEEIYDMIGAIGRLVGAPGAAQACVDEMRTRLEAVTAQVQGREHPTVYYATGFGEYGDFTAGGDTFIHALITMAGGDNIAKDVSGWSITTEAIFEADPQIILVGETLIDAFLADPLYGELTAVKEGRVYGVNEDLLNRQGPRLPDAVEQMAGIFYPDLSD